VLAGSPKTPTNDPTDIASIKQLELDMGDAMVAADTNKLNQIFADDWATIGTSGAVITKEKILRELGSGEDRLVWFKNGPIDVQVLGNVAVAHASVVEKRIRNGKDDSGESVWMDLLEKRAGKWVVVRSGSAMVK
jgi:hypothetical protein